MWDFYHILYCNKHKHNITYPPTLPTLEIFWSIPWQLMLIPIPCPGTGASWLGGTCLRL